jgi:hypothetical protein
VKLGLGDKALKLFQIEEPDGSPVDAEAPGAAIGIDIAGALAEVAVAVGGNAIVLTDREGFAIDLAVPPMSAPTAKWQTLFEGARLRAERMLGRPVTHAVVAIDQSPPPALTDTLTEAAAAAGIELLRVEMPSTGEAPVLAAAILAEDLAPRPEGD